MKKVLLVLVALMLVAAPAMAIIKGSKHDLSSASGGGTLKDATASTEICVYCHTPHNANTSADPTVYLPLWNRTVTALAVTSVYNTSSTLSPAARAVTTADVGGIDAALCLSCHDGSSLTDPLANPSNVDGAPTYTGTGQVNANATIDGNFNNDHPVAFSYSAAQSVDNELQPIATPSGLGLPFFAGANGSDELWCSTCHDVHKGESTPNFMVISNTGSALCYACHIK